MERPSNNFQSSHHRSYQPNNNVDDEPISRKPPMRQNKKRALPLSSAAAEGCDTDEKINLSTTCNLSPSQTARITELFDHSLIACVVGRKISSQYLADRLHRLFRLTGTLAVTELGRGYFVVKFSESSDCSEALEGRPWSIPNVCISFSPWIPNFKPSKAAIAEFDVWVRLPELCIEYYDREVLQQIAETIGTLVKIDPVTENREKCKFARFCIKVNLSNPLPSEIKLGEITQKIEYEGLHLLCSRCRRVDDLNQNCSNLTNPSGCFPQPKAQSYRHPNCRQNYEIGSSSKQPLVADELPPSGSRFQILGEDEMYENPCRLMGEYETAATGTSSSLPSVNVGLKLAQNKHHHFPGLKAEATVNFNSGASAQKVSHGHLMSSTSKAEASSRTINAPELKENNLVQSMSSAPSIADTQFTDLQLAQRNDPLAAESCYNNQSAEPLTVSIPYPSPSPQSPPISEASLKFYSTGILHSTIEKEISSTSFTEVSAKSCPTVYTIDPTVENLEIGLSEATMSNQNVLRFMSTTRGGNEYGIGSGAKSESCSSNKLLCWNYRGTDSIKLMRALKDLIQLHKPSVVLIFGTKISGADTDQVVQDLAFGGSYCRKPDGCSGGIWMFLSRQDVQIEINSYSSAQISASVYFHSGTNKPLHDVIDANTETSSQPWGPSFFYSPSSLIDNALAY